MPDNREQVRSLPFPAIAPLLGIDLKKFRRSGQEWAGPCPIHGGKNSAAFRYNDSGVYNCFGEGCKGRGAIDLAMAVLKIGFQAAVERLSSIEPPKQKEPRSEAPVESGEVLLKPYTGKYQNYQVPCEWLEKRIPDAGIREKYGVFCYNNPAKRSAYSGRVMLPVRDMQGNLYGHLGRAVLTTSNQTPDTPKYLFPPGFPKSRFLFGGYELRQHLAALGTGRSLFQQVYLLESPFAVMKFASMGLPAVSPFGWSVSKEQIAILCLLAKSVVYLPDSNKMDNIAPCCVEIARRLLLRAPLLPKGMDDPEYLSVEQIRGL